MKEPGKTEEPDQLGDGSGGKVLAEQAGEPEF